MFKNWIFWLVTAIFLILGLSSYYFLSSLDKAYVDNTSKILQSLVFYVTGYGVFFTVYATLSQLSLLKEDKESERLFKMKEEAFKLVLRWDDPALLNARNYSRQLRDSHADISGNDLIAQIKGDMERSASVSVLFNYAEHIKISAIHGIANKEILGNVCYALKDILKRFQPYSDDLAKNSDLQKKDNEQTMKVLDECIKAYEQALNKP